MEYSVQTDSLGSKSDNSGKFVPELIEISFSNNNNKTVTINVSLTHETYLFIINVIHFVHINT